MQVNENLRVSVRTVQLEVEWVSAKNKPSIQRTATSTSQPTRLLCTSQPSTPTPQPANHATPQTHKRTNTVNNSTNEPYFESATSCGESSGCERFQVAAVLGTPESWGASVASVGCRCRYYLCPAQSVPPSCCSCCCPSHPRPPRQTPWGPVWEGRTCRPPRKSKQTQHHKTCHPPPQPPQQQSHHHHHHHHNNSNNIIINNNNNNINNNNTHRTVPSRIGQIP